MGARRLVLRYACILWLAVAHPWAAVAAEFEIVAPKVISITGPIELGDCERWKAALQPGLESVRLDSPGGRNGQGECISRSIHALRLKTVVPRKCSSICFLLFAAGAVRSACEGARIGIHRPANAKTKEEGDDPHYLQVILRYARRYGVPEPIAEKLAATPNHSIYYLTESDLAAMRVGACG